MRSDYETKKARFFIWRQVIVKIVKGLPQALLILALMSGCTTASLPVGGANVNIAPTNAAYTANCEYLGQVSSQMGKWSYMPVWEVRTQNVYNMRAEAYNRYGADTIVISTVQDYFAVGSALKCKKN